MSLTGANLIEGVWEEGEGRAFRAVAPATGEQLPGAFRDASPAQVGRACAAADAAALVYAETSTADRAAFLEGCADALDDLGDPLIERCMAESGLPRPRLEGELKRTSGQLRMFAGEVRAGAWRDLRIDPADRARVPAPKPDLRLRKVALGPVAVFGASNFPLAFSTAGGDTAAALAAGCPVVVKGHPAHPGACEMVAEALRATVARHRLPAGVFSLVHGIENQIGAALVQDPRIQAVGFTGSRGGGLSLMRLAADRASPIPVFAEMSSVNPVFLLPAALAARADALGAAYIASLTLGAGQFCTNPGLVFALEGPDLDRFLAAAGAAMRDCPAGVMLSRAIHRSYESGAEHLANHADVSEVARGKPAEGDNRGRSGLFTTTVDAFRRDPGLSHEVFGASSLVVRCRDVSEMIGIAEGLEGQLTATLHLDDADMPLGRKLLPILERRCGRVLANGWPTGVEVSPAMVHGGPFPATSDGRSTSVGTLAMQRFLRPICYQDLPTALLPIDLRPD